MTTNFTTRFTQRLTQSIWQELLKPTVQAIKWERFICDITVRKGNFYLYITLYDDEKTPVGIEICYESPSNRLADKHLPNIQHNLARELKGFWQYAADKAFLEQIDEAMERVRKYEREHHIQFPETQDNSNDRRRAYSTPSNFNDKGQGGKIYHKRKYKRLD